MGVNLAILFDHQMKSDDLLHLPSRAMASNSLRHAANDLWTVMKPRWAALPHSETFGAFRACDPLSSELIEETWRRGTDTTMPSFTWAGLDIEVGRHAAVAIHLEKLSVFVLDLEGLREPLRRCAHALGIVFGSTRIAYGPDSASPFEIVAHGVPEGRNLGDILDAAGVACGAAAPEIRLIADADGHPKLDRGCYVVETIANAASPSRIV